MNQKKSKLCLEMTPKEFNDRLQKLTPEEIEFLKLFLKVRSQCYKEIAKYRGVAEVTVRTHIKRICKKFGSDRTNRDGLTDLFIEHNGAWVANCVREQRGFSLWEDPDSDRNIERTGSNFYLERAKKERDPQQALKWYEEAVNGDRSDPYAQIYLNNAKARQARNTLKIGVVIAKAGNDFHEFASIQVLRGVADAQTKFNQSGGKNGRLLEIDIRNDGNRPSDAIEIAEEFVEDPDILAIVGHHSSESTKVVLSVYEPKSIVAISPTSTSSELRGRNFFRTVGSTQAVASKYSQYIMDYLKLDRIAIIYHGGNEFSETLKKDFENTFTRRMGSRGQRGEITRWFDITDISLNILESIEDIKKESDAVLIISSIETNSVAIAIANKNAQQLESQQLKLLFATSLPEPLTLEKGGTSLEGVVLVSPSLNTESKYMQEAKDRWQQPVNWRSATAFDATQAIIEAIKRSTAITRESILENLETIELDVDRTSGFGLIWNTDDWANTRIKYSVWKVCRGWFEEINLSDI